MRSRGKYFGNLALLFLSVSASSFVALAQEPADKPRPIAEVPAAASRPSPEADETFQLNIAERRFIKERFEASTAVEAGGGASGVQVRVGVSLNADKIEVLLRNVHGSVRFRGTLNRILEVIGRRTTSATEVR